MSQVYVCCGVGGAGKTTTAAALGLAHAMTGKRVVVLTIDPARRLADALGIQHLGNHPQPLPLPEGSPEGASLHALMLDRKATWDDVIREHAPNAASAERILANRYYVALSERLTGGHEYMATEKLYALAQADRWDVLVVDTPPSQHALDFFLAPDRIRRVLDRRLLGALLQPSDGIWGAATRRVSGLVRRLAGAAVMDDLSEFFHLVADVSAGFRERGAAVRDLLRSPTCHYLLVVHADAPRTDDVLAFVRTLRDQQMRFEGCFINRVVEPLSPGTAALRKARPPAPQGLDASEWDAAIDVLLTRAASHDARAAHHAELGQLLRDTTHKPTWALPDLRRGVDSLERLQDLANHIPT